ncbi:MAG: TRAP transporter large permease subunit [Spirochaetes bacterium]|nr:TRAP transporter large permease subunit [Spirochaetota bacterium]
MKAKPTVAGALDLGIAVASAAAAFFLVVLPIADFFAARVFGANLVGPDVLAQHMTIVLTFAGAIAASRSGKHLAIVTPRRDTSLMRSIAVLVFFLTIVVQCVYFWASFSLVFLGFDPGERAWFVPVRLFALAIPVGFLGMTVADIARSKVRGILKPLVAMAALAAGSILAGGSIANLLGIFLPSAAAPAGALAAFASGMGGFVAWPGFALLVVLAFFGLPLYAVLGGTAAFFFILGGSVVELAVTEFYAMLGSPQIAAVPLFTIAGFVMAASKSGERLIRLFKAAFGKVPGGSAVAAVLVCVFFSTFTGSSGVAILALGPILAVALVGSGQMSESRAHGLLTSSGALGLLFPPSLAVILYGVTAQYAYGPERPFDLLGLFRGGILPGLLLCGSTAFYAAFAFRSIPAGAEPDARPPDKLGKALIAAAPELAVPFVVAFLFFSSLASILETGAITAAYTVALGIVRGDTKWRASLKSVLEASLVIGGTLVLLATARGLSYFIVDSGMPGILTAFVIERVHSRIVFLLLVNLILFVAGCLMDVFAAILVLVPILIPMSDAFGIHPIHFGVIFVANLTVGFLTPPVGMNLFLGSYAFGKPLTSIWKSVVPYFLIQVAVVFAITYIPWLSTAFAGR